MAFCPFQTNEISECSTRAVPEAPGGATKIEGDNKSYSLLQSKKNANIHKESSLALQRVKEKEFLSSLES